MKDIVLLIITSHLLVLFLFVADKLVGNRPSGLTISYYIRAFVSAVAVLVLLVCLDWAVRTIPLEQRFMEQTAPIVAFVAACYVVRVVLMNDAPIDRAIWVALLTWVLVHAADAALRLAFKTALWADVF